MAPSMRDLLNRLDVEHGLIRVEGTGAAPLMNARAIAVELRRLLLGDFDERRDTSEFQKLERGDGDPGDDTDPGA